MSKQNITLDISEKTEDTILNDSDNNSENENDNENESESDCDITQEQQEKFDGWLKEEESNLLELEKLKKIQELTWKKIKENIEIQKKRKKTPNFSISHIQKKIKKENDNKKREFNKQQNKNSRIHYFRMKLF